MRTARPGETLAALNGESYDLDPANLEGFYKALALHAGRGQTVPTVVNKTGP